MMNSFFIKHPLLIAPSNERMKESAEIVNKAISEIDPYAIGLMLSGGDDSVTALHVALKLGCKIDFVIHGVTGTGLPIVRKYVNELCEQNGLRLFEADAGTSFEDYVYRKGFFGKGKDAHKFSYHVLKNGHFESCLSKNIIQRKRGRKILLLNGVRVEESENRADNFGDNPIRWRKNFCWVNIIHWWDKKECLDFLSECKVKRNPASIALGASRECICGTMQSEADIIAASEFDTVWGKWMFETRKAVTKKFGWDITQNPKKSVLDEIKAVAATLTEDMPMCVGCKANSKNTLF